jgi:mono/diheme cytochrome c family protein
MRSEISNVGDATPPRRVRNFVQRVFVCILAATAIFGSVVLLLPLRRVQAARVPSAPGPGRATPAGAAVPLADALGVHFIEGSTSSVLIERDGKEYVINLAHRTIQVKESPAVAAALTPPAQPTLPSSAKDLQAGAKVFAANCTPCHGPEGKGIVAIGTPNFTDPSVQATFSDEALIKTIRGGKKGTAMPAWGGKLTTSEINSVAAFVRSLGSGKKSPEGAGAAPPKQQTNVYTPADDYLYSLPTGRRLERHGFYINFTHRFAFNPAFTGPGEGDTLMGLDGYSLSSFGFRFGVTDKLSISAYRSPSLIGRPIELGAAYHLLDEHDGAPLNATFRVSVDGQADFARNFTTNFEGVFSRSLARRAQLYLVPTVSIEDRRLIQKPGTLEAPPPSLPGVNTFSLGVGGALDIRPTVALISEVIPTLVNGPELGIHRPAYAIGIQKRVFRHAFTLGFSNSPGTIVAQRAGTRATFVGDPSADTPKGLFIGFDLMRQIY